MNKWIALFLAILLTVGWQYAASAQTGIVLENADGQSLVTPGMATDLTQHLVTVDERIVLEHANGLEYVPLVQTPLALRTLFGQMVVRFVIEHANGNEVKGLAQPGAALRDLLATMSPRFILEHANGNQFVTLSYPKTLIGDTTKPTLLSLEISTEGSSIIITWHSNEFTRFVLRYGTAPGNYTETVIETLYADQHDVELTTLQEGQTYYFVIESEDISGNKATTDEQRLEVRQRTFQFLPNLQR